MIKRLSLLAALGATTAGAAMLLLHASEKAQAQTDQCGNGDGLTLPPGFCATVFADISGHARQMAMGRTGRFM